MQKRRLITIVAEAAVEREILHVLDEIKATGYTISEARGKGHHGERSRSWNFSSNVRIEVVCEAALAERIAERLQADYFDDFAMIVFIADVDVLRADRF